MNETVSIGTMFSNLPHLRKYAAQVIIDGQYLSDAQELDKEARLSQFKYTGKALNWTDKEMTILILRETFARSAN